MAATLARKGYETAMPVQAAVLDPQFEARDLLVTSQTGSGKTIAFGLAMAPTLLEGKPPVSDKRVVIPRVLVVAPTRELATQVSNELTWLFADAPVRLASFTGGTPVTTDLRRLRMGVDVVVGTPGRLVDLQARGSLDLSAIKVLVLDEADEMLDMGFKDDLEALLNAAPAERRTLMFSATIAGPIARLASTYQNNAQRIDMRPAGGSKAHTDINFVAHLVPLRDRFAALANTLIANPEAKAIVFVRTREGVGELQHKLVAHGFSAVAMAGDRAQGERDRALAALRSGAARVLVATNVAARGLDIPDVEFVVHGDLPEGTESLTHRSGRTGRAGRKGTSIILADPPKRRRAERLFLDAGVKVKWSPPTTLEQAQRAAEDQLASRLMEQLSGLPAEGDAEFAAEDLDPRAEANQKKLKESAEALADRLLAALPERDLISVLLQRELQRLPQALPVEVLPIDPPSRKPLTTRRIEPDFDGGRMARPVAARPVAARREAPVAARREAPVAARREAPLERPQPEAVTISARGASEAFSADGPLRAPRKPRIEGTSAQPPRATPGDAEAGTRAKAPRERQVRTAPRDEGEERPAPRETAPRSGGNAGRSVIFRVNLGAEAQAEPRTLLPLICRRGGIDRTAVGSIRVGQQSSTFEIAANAAVSFARAAMRPDPQEPNVRIEAARPPENGDAPPPSRTGGGGAPPKRHKPGARATAF